MTDEGGTQKSLIAVILVLVVSLVVVFLLWQRDQDSQDLRIDFDTGNAEAVVEPGPRLALSTIRRPNRIPAKPTDSHRLRPN